MVEAFRQLQEAELRLSDLGQNETNTATDLLQDRSSQERKRLRQEVNRLWDRFAHVDCDSHELRLRSHADRSTAKSSVDWDSLIHLSVGLDLLDDNISRLSIILKKEVVEPLFLIAPGSGERAASVAESDQGLKLQGHSSTLDIDALIGNASTVISYLHKHLPTEVSNRVSESLMPPLISRLISHGLSVAIPTQIERSSELKPLLALVKEFAGTLDSFGWVGASDLNEWVENIPRNWLSKKRESSIAQIRVFLSTKLAEKKTIERIETEVIKNGDLLGPKEEPVDDWNEDWSDEGATDDSSGRNHAVQEEDEETSAWDMDADGPAYQPGSDNSRNGHQPDDEEETTDAWDWDDQNPSSAPSSPKKVRKQPSKVALVNGHSRKSPSSNKEVTLRETYTVSGIPDELYDLIIQFSEDAAALRRPENSSSPVAPAALGLYSLPTLTLAGFRALSPTYYEMIDGGNMFLYNDSMRLAERLASFAQSVSEMDTKSTLSRSQWPSTRMKLDAEIRALESFGRRAYGKEMGLHRTILRDLIEGAQGFANCTEAPFAAECKNAVSMTTDHLRGVGKRFEKILSKSALLQSLGSLLSTVISKMIMDIEDMSDIGDDESKRLREYCDEMSKLSDMFIQEGPEGMKSDVTGIYTPNWFKFQYLSELLESNLADIRYLWTEGELKLEFEKEELVDLIEALFADSDRRRLAIAEIKKG